MNKFSIKSSIIFNIILLSLIFNKFSAYSKFNTKFSFCTVKTILHYQIFILFAYFNNILYNKHVKKFTCLFWMKEN